MTQPTIFFGHGSPMNAIEENEFTKKWQEIGKNLVKAKAILIISAHWVSKGSFLTGANNLETIYDFGGFPQELFETKYKASGHSNLAKEIVEKLKEENILLDPEYGLDHGSWSVLKHLFPKGDVPILQFSLDYSKTNQEHFELGQKLSFLRDENVLILASGNIVHNLGKVVWDENLTFDWAKEFDNEIVEAIKNRDFQKVIDFPKLGIPASLSVPTPEHFWPLLYILGASKPSDKIEIFNQKVMMGSLNMTGVGFYPS